MSLLRLSLPRRHPAFKSLSAGLASSALSATTWPPDAANGTMRAAVKSLGALPDNLLAAWRADSARKPDENAW